MKKLLLIIFMSINIWAHTPEILINDNHNGTFTLSVKFINNPGEAEDSIISLVRKKDKKILLEKYLDETEQIVLYKLNNEYYLNIYVMPGHEYDVYEVPILSQDEKKVWENKIKEDKVLTKKEKKFLLGD